MQTTLFQSLAAAAVVTTLASAAVIPSHAGEFPPSAHRRHHAKLSEMAKRNISPRALLSNTGFGTLYYDINGGGTCGPANGWSSFPETQGYAMCEPWQSPKTIAQRGTNRIVALPVSMMSGNLDKYCGKEVTATYNGKTISGLIAWDGCAACDSGNGIDFSSTLFGELVGTDKCGAGKVQGVTWEVKENSIWDRNGNPVGGSSFSDSDSPSTSSTLVSESVVESRTSSVEEQEEATPIAAHQKIEVNDNDNDDDEKEDNIASLRLPILAAKPTSSSKIVEAQAQATEKASSAAPLPSSPSSSWSNLGACNDKAGQWKCDGRSLQQCIQDGNNWVWSERFECSVEPINCDTANPVCPGKATGARKLRL